MSSINVHNSNFCDSNVAYSMQFQVMGVKPIIFVS
jgi:hypothetical protein